MSGDKLKQTITRAGAKVREKLKRSTADIEFSPVVFLFFSFIFSACGVSWASAFLIGSAVVLEHLRRDALKQLPPPADVPALPADQFQRSPSAEGGFYVGPGTIIELGADLGGICDDLAELISRVGAHGQVTHVAVSEDAYRKLLALAVHLKIYRDGEPLIFYGVAILKREAGAPPVPTTRQRLQMEVERLQSRGATLRRRSRRRARAQVGGRGGARPARQRPGTPA